MFGVLDRYIGKTIFNTIIMTLFMLVSLSGIIKFVDQLRKVGQGEYSALGAGMYTLLSVPKDVEIFFPMAALLGALLGLGQLATRSELVVMQASGFTRLQIAGSVMKTAIPLVLLTMAIGEWVAPQGEQMARNYRAPANVRRFAAVRPKTACGRRTATTLSTSNGSQARTNCPASISTTSTIVVGWKRCAMPPPPPLKTAPGSCRR
ncbi:Lipopolysaccharide export system permease protein lptG [Serratia odorifera]|uniref:Lipopolysaccharide export system permease protein lptG n=1 Tax=Serratia odorifera TaxID=618 RepID=A0A447KMU8_SEROD|nr:Lipopolysaccharide export system permease protein lptG [Serratia odorifera]